MLQTQEQAISERSEKPADEHLARRRARLRSDVGVPCFRHGRSIRRGRRKITRTEFHDQGWDVQASVRR